LTFVNPNIALGFVFFFAAVIKNSHLFYVGLTETCKKEAEYKAISVDKFQLFKTRFNFFKNNKLIIK
jgi:hypothetical protein